MPHNVISLARDNLLRGWATSIVRPRRPAKPTVSPAVARRPDPEWRGDNEEILVANDDEVILAGPAETGKTFSCCWKLDKMLRRWPGAQGTLVRKVRGTIYGTVMLTLQSVFNWNAGDGITVSPYGGQKPEWIQYSNGSRLWIAGLDDPGKALSSERDVIYVNQAEEITVAEWEVLLTRTTGRAGHVDHPMLFGDCNPGPPHHWIKKRAGLRILESRHRDNPSLYAWDPSTQKYSLTLQGKRTMSRLDKLTGIRRERLRDGRWVSAEGAVYKFDPNIHLVDKFAIPSRWTLLRSIDFGYVNPFVCLWMAVDEDGRIYVYREWYMSRRTVARHADKIKELSEGERYSATVADHDREDRETLHECGIWTEPAIKELDSGIEAVENRLVVQDDGKPRLFLVRNCLVERDEEMEARYSPICTEQEFDAYIRPPAGTGEKAAKEQPIDKDNHGMDALRYGVRWVDRWLRQGDDIDVPDEDQRVMAARAPSGVFHED